MAKRKTAAEWNVFLRALKRTGNARVAAAGAGMDVGTAYDRRIKDARFAARWEAALAKAKARAAPPSRKASADKEELVARRSKRHGTQMVRAAPGRWSAAKGRAFLDTLRHTGCVRAAARAAGLSTTTFYNRRKAYPEFAAAWAAAEAEAATRVPALLTAATIASLDPEIEDEDLPRVNIDQAIAICRLKGPRSKLGNGWSGRESGSGGGGAPPPSIEAVRDDVLRRIAAIRRHRAEGRSQAPPLPEGEGE